MNNGVTNICKDCKWGKDHFKDACYCVQYGYIVSKAKTKCGGYKPNEQVREQKVGTGRENV